MKDKLAEVRLNLVLPVRTESFPSAAQRKLAVLTAIADVLAGRSLAAYCNVLGDMRSIAPYCFGLGVAKPRALPPPVSDGFRLLNGTKRSASRRAEVAWSRAEK